MFKYADRVRIDLPIRGSEITPYMKGFDGDEATVSKVIFFQSQRAYELYGIVSEKGKAYTFEEAWLKPIGKEQNDETDGSHT